MINFVVLCRSFQRGGRVCLPIATIVWCFNAPVLAAELHCRLERGTTVLHHVQKPVPDPYGVAPVPAGPGFQFKSLVFEEQGQVAHVLVHAYYLRNGQPTLLHQANYTRPVVPTTDLTGEQVVVEPHMGRELRYRCALLEGLS